MKKFKKSLICFILFLFYKNSIYATTTGTYTVPESNMLDKVFILIIGALLVSLVLFIAYKMDKSEANIKRRQKYIKENKKESNIQDANEYSDDIYSNIYSTRSSNRNMKIKREDIFKYDSKLDNDEDDIDKESERFDNSVNYNGLEDYNKIENEASYEEEYNDVNVDESLFENDFEESLDNEENENFDDIYENDYDVTQNTISFETQLNYDSINYEK